MTSPPILHLLPEPAPSQGRPEVWINIAATAEDGITLERRDGPRSEAPVELTIPHALLGLEPNWEPPPAPERIQQREPSPVPELIRAVQFRGWVSGTWNTSFDQQITPRARAQALDHFLAAKVLVVPRSERWREAVSTALLGGWCEPLWQTGRLPNSALDALKAEARMLHRQLVPLWKRGTRHGRVLSLDAALGDGLSLYDLVAADIDHLRHAADGVFTDERLKAVLRGLTPDERRVVVAYAAGEGTTWTEAATVAGATAPEAFGERVRRKAKRLADEQRRRAAQRRSGSTPPC
ncbi:hypothetical protein [Streptomyces olivochromogenes]|uniref:hypothetical protein n=1 Tax=Streptomyces olivochromogenes TaxID=1963 RepID=UPI001F2224A2|nr:hypothetical protein [Streptomyces olivochromogenes]MCF3132432.1 hypothetical protein [Streptomyces olivochromogenes]